MKVGYARVSSVGQNLESQLVALKEYGCEKIFQEKASGTSTKGREQLTQCLEFVRESDEFVVTRIDRCSRSVLDLQLIVKQLDEKGVSLAATEQSVFSEFETNIRKERQMDGIKVNKHKFKGKQTTIDVKRIKALKDEGLGATAIAKDMGIDRTSVYRLLKRIEA